MTREEIRTRVLTHLRENSSGATFWDSTEIDAFTQEAQELLAEEVRAWRRTIYLPKREGVQFYDIRGIAPDCLAPYRVWDQTTHQRLGAITMRQLDDDRYRWLSTTGTQPLWWYPVSWGRFGVHPATGEGGGVLRVECLMWPTPLMDDDEEPEGSEADHDALVWYGEYSGLIQQWEVPRAQERLVKVMTGWKDARARADVARLDARQPQRRRSGR